MATSTLSSSTDKTKRTSPAEQPQDASESLKRAILSLLILFHLFALFTAVASNRPTSQLLGGLQRVPGVREYLELMGMDRSYRFELTYGAMEDRGFRVQAELTMPDDTKKSLVFPDVDMSIARSRHYAPLLRLWAANVEDDAAQALVAHAIAHRLMKEHGAKNATVDLQARWLLNQDEVRGGADPDAVEQFVSVYKGRAWYDAEGGPQFMKTSDNSESAPAPREPAAQ